MIDLDRCALAFEKKISLERAAQIHANIQRRDAFVFSMLSSMESIWMPID